MYIYICIYTYICIYIYTYPRTQSTDLCSFGVWSGESGLDGNKDLLFFIKNMMTSDILIYSYFNNLQIHVRKRSFILRRWGGRGGGLGRGAVGRGGGVGRGGKGGRGGWLAEALKARGGGRGASGLGDPGAEGRDSGVDSRSLRSSTADPEGGHTCQSQDTCIRGVCVCVCVCVCVTDQSESSVHRPDKLMDPQSHPKKTSLNFMNKNKPGGAQ